MSIFILHLFEKITITKDVRWQTTKKYCESSYLELGSQFYQFLHFNKIVESYLGETKT